MRIHFNFSQGKIFFAMGYHQFFLHFDFKNNHFIINFSLTRWHSCNDFLDEREDKILLLLNHDQGTLALDDHNAG